MVEMDDFHVETKNPILHSRSNLKCKHLSPSILSLINEVFGSLSYKILWKFEDPHLTNKQNNIFISAWFSQVDILTSPRVKLFYDQETNVNRAQKMNFALALDINNLTKASYRETILDMTNDKSDQNVKEISQVYHNQSIKPIDLAIYWTEYILRHRGAYHMQTKAQKMRFMKKHSLDSLALMITGAFVVFIVCCCLIVKIIKAKHSVKIALPCVSLRTPPKIKLFPSDAQLHYGVYPALTSPSAENTFYTIHFDEADNTNPKINVRK
uniref:Uncharacterized protein n=1 Tax=Glossina palpalis gambiensis TaxID=67801 RepID=A0A1B0ARZ9_9MUSC